jgi:hypothetical protein
VQSSGLEKQEVGRGLLSDSLESSRRVGPQEISLLPR